MSMHTRADILQKYNYSQSSGAIKKACAAVSFLWVMFFWVKIAQKCIPEGQTQWRKPCIGLVV